MDSDDALADVAPKDVTVTAAAQARVMKDFIGGLLVFWFCVPRLNSQLRDEPEMNPRMKHR
jgi:hypothetical protein